jgi:hypothetical protein
MAQYSKNRTSFYPNENDDIFEVGLLGTKDGNVVSDINPLPVTMSQAAYYGSNKPFYLNVAQGLIPGYSGNHKFGAVPLMSINTTGTVWDINDTLYPWDSWTTPGTITLDRANAADINHIVRVEGLDASFNFVSVDITLTDVSNASAQVFSRINRMYLLTDGNANLGHINAVKGGVTVARITALKGQTLMSVFTIPAGKTGYLINVCMSTQTNGDGSGQVMVRDFGDEVFLIKHAFEISGEGGHYMYDFHIPTPITEKSDIDIRAISRANNGRYTAVFDILLVDN